MDAILQLDQNILLFIQEYIRHDWMDWFWKGITHLGDFGIFWILLTIVLLIPKKTRKAGLASALALIIGTLITNVAIKNVVARIRPGLVQARTLARCSRKSFFQNILFQKQFLHYRFIYYTFLTFLNLLEILPSICKDGMKIEPHFFHLIKNRSVS